MLIGQSSPPPRAVIGRQTVGGNTERWNVSKLLCLHVKLIALCGKSQHRPSESRLSHIHNNLISREMRRNDGWAPGEPTIEFSKIFNWARQSVQFDEYWLETNMTKLHAEQSISWIVGIVVEPATASYEVTSDGPCGDIHLKALSQLSRGINSTVRESICYRRVIKLYWFYTPVTANKIICIFARPCYCYSMTILCRH